MVTSDDKNKILSKLMLAAIDGNKNEYSEFLTKTVQFLKPIIAKKIPAADVDDVIQEILISIHNARHTYDGKRPIVP